MILDYLRRAHLTLNSYIEHYSRVDKKPTIASALFLSPYLFFKGFKGYGLLARFMKSASYPGEHLVKSIILPEIELLFVSTEKDSLTLPYAISNAIQNIENRISKIVVIVPQIQLPFFKSLLQQENYFHIVELRSEDDEILEKDRLLMRRVMGARYGWTLQQFLTLSYCLRSHAKGVLAINSDTILLRNQTWLDNRGSQILMESYEFNHDYYELIERVNPKFSNLNKSHITHHMIFQPALLNECLKYFGTSNISEFISLFMQSVNPQTASPICAEFEPYAQYLRKIHPERVQMVKFGNLGVDRVSETALPELLAKYAAEKKYNSISLHSWMA